MTGATPSDALPTVYALIWRAAATDDAWDPAAFQERLPRMMAWLRTLKAEGRLVACGGGGFEDRSGGLTLVRAASPQEALADAARNPMNEIGRTELLVWDVFHADLRAPREFQAARLVRRAPSGTRSGTPCGDVLSAPVPFSFPEDGGTTTVLSWSGQFTSPTSYTTTSTWTWTDGMDSCPGTTQSVATKP